MSHQAVLYRIGVINDFRNSWAFVDYRNFGEVISTQALVTSWPHRGYDSSEDRIYVFENIKRKVLITTSKKEAWDKIQLMIDTAPSQAYKELVNHQGYLLKAIEG